MLQQLMHSIANAIVVLGITANQLFAIALRNDIMSRVNAVPLYFNLTQFYFLKETFFSSKMTGKLFSYFHVQLTVTETYWQWIESV